MAALFEVAGASRVYRTGAVDVHALRDASLEVEEGEVLVLLGPSGCGKSTLLNVLGGMDRVTAGAVRFRGRDLGALDDHGRTMFRRRHVGFVFQFYNLIPTLTALENVRVAAEVAAAPLDPGEVLARVGLAARRDHFPAQLSGGEQQRVAIARALVGDPDVYLCDEPTGALDLAAARRVLAALLAVNEARGKTLVIVTHNAALATVGDRVATMRDGAVTEVRTRPRRVPPEELEW